MSGSAIADLILFIAAVTVAAGVAATLTLNVATLGDSIDARSADISADIDTDIEIISDPGSNAIANETHVKILVKNTGRGTLEAIPDQVDVVLDGQYVTVQSVTVVSGSDWGPGEVAEIVVEQPDTFAAGVHRVVIIVDGDRDELEFRT